MKPLFVMFYVSLLLTFRAALIPLYGRRAALFGAALLALVPQITAYAGTGLADVPMAAYLVGAAAAAAGTYGGGSERGWLTAGMLLGLAAWVKHDALIFIAVAALLLALARRPLPWLRCMVPALALALPWYCYAAIVGAPDRDFYSANLHNLATYSDRLGPIARLFALNLLATNEWSVLWLAVILLAIRAGMRGQWRSLLLLAPVVLPLVAYIVSLSLSAWPDYTLHVRTSLDRLIMVTAPFGLWFVINQGRDLKIVKQAINNQPRPAPDRSIPVPGTGP